MKKEEMSKKDKLLDFNRKLIRDLKFKRFEKGGNMEIAREVCDLKEKKLLKSIEKDKYFHHTMIFRTFNSVFDKIESIKKISTRGLMTEENQDPTIDEMNRNNLSGTDVISLFDNKESLFDDDGFPIATFLIEPFDGIKKGGIYPDEYIHYGNLPPEKILGMIPIHKYNKGSLKHIENKYNLVNILSVNSILELSNITMDELDNSKNDYNQFFFNLFVLSMLKNPKGAIPIYEAKGDIILPSSKEEFENKFKRVFP